MTEPSEPTLVQQRQTLKDLWAELEPWVVASDEWTTAKVAASPDSEPVAPGSPVGERSPKQLNDIEEWRHSYRKELDSVEHTLSTLPARSAEEVAEAIAAAEELLKIPRAGFRG
jgi:hypothetical protein